MTRPGNHGVRVTGTEGVGVLRRLRPPPPLLLGGVAVIVAAAVAASIYLIRGAGPPARASANPASRARRSPHTCPLTGLRPSRPGNLHRPAVALKIENYPGAYPDSGLGRADLVFEEPVEGGLTRFVAIYGCSDAAKAGPVRSARPIDPYLVRPITRLEGDAGGDAEDIAALRKGGIVSITGTVRRPGEILAGSAMRRIPRPGLSYEHTLYADTAALRRVGERRFHAPPPAGVLRFARKAPRAPAARRIRVDFEGATVVGYRYRHGRYYRYEGTTPFTSPGGRQLSFANVLVLRCRIGLSRTDVDVLGHGAPILLHPFGSGRAYLFRNGRVIRGMWHRSVLRQPYRFTTPSGKPMALRPGHTIIEVLPDRHSQIHGSLSYGR